MTDIAIKIVVFLGLCALVAIAVSVLGIPIPGWVYQAVGVVIVVVCIVLGIRFISSQSKQ